MTGRLFEVLSATRPLRVAGGTRVSRHRVCLGGQAVEYRLARVPGRRRLTLLVDDQGELWARVPPHCSRDAAEAFLQSQRAWVVAALAAAAARRPPPLAAGRRLPYLDAHLVLRLGAAGARRRVERAGEELWVSGPDLDQGRLREGLEDWYREEARRHLGARLERFAPDLGVARPRLVVRDPRTRWGSCSSRGIVNLSWRLMLVPSCLGDYVVVHELAHLLRMDHSPAFWAEVERVLPDWRERRHDLRQYTRGRLIF